MTILVYFSSIVRILGSVILNVKVKRMGKKKWESITALIVSEWRDIKSRLWHFHGLHGGNLAKGKGHKSG